MSKQKQLLNSNLNKNTGLQTTNDGEISMVLNHLFNVFTYQGALKHHIYAFK